MKRLTLALAGLLAAGMAQAESALTSRAVDLLAEAQSDAATIATLAEHTRVEVLVRKGAWNQVKTAAGQAGWVRMMSLKVETSGSTASAPSSNPLGGLTSLLSSGRSDNSATVTTGVRGLTEEDLQNAQANPDELEKMRKFGVDKKAGQSFAQRSKLAPMTMEYLPEPAPVSNPEPNPEGG